MGYGTTLYRHTVTHEPYLGESAVGPTFGAPADLRCRFRTERKVIRTARGDEIVADATLECRASESVDEKDRITRDTRVYRVAEIIPAEGPHSRTNHLEVRLTAD